MGREDAVRVVEDELDRESQRWAALGVDPIRTKVMCVEEHELVWKVYWQSEEYVRTRNPAAMLVGHGPYLVDRVDGGLHQIGVVSEKGGEWEADYRTRIRGMRVRTAVDDLHDEIRELAAARGRMHSVRALRQRLPALSPAQALGYVKALQVGGEPSPQLVAVAVERLVEPLNPVLAVQTVRRGGPHRTVRPSPTDGVDDEARVDDEDHVDDEDEDDVDGMDEVEAHLARCDRGRCDQATVGTCLCRSPRGGGGSGHGASCGSAQAPREAQINL
ncbi:YrhB domain-containing protein [Streptomyces sp. NPDC048611]|uniref:YrhB domain-containing protein n=1 Tax=Streptomyces sp. NPDC048611 TaxID=3155635 RepID=UPI003422FCFE